MIGIIALATLIGFTFITCSNPTGGGGGGSGSGGGPCDSSADLGPPLVLSGQVYVKDDSGLIPVYSNYKPGRNLEITDFDYNGSGTITSNGKLKFSIGAPASEYLMSFDVDTLRANLDFAEFYDFYTDLAVNPAGVYGYVLTTLTCWESSPIFFINENSSVSSNGNSATGTDEKLVFIYVGSDVTFSGKGIPLYGGIATSNDFNLALKQGWNAVSVKDTWSATLSGSETSTETISLSNPPLNWILEYNF